MKIGIVGLPGSGKTTIFNALTGLKADTGPGGKTKENMGVIKVPDPRVMTLAEMHESKKTVFAEVTFVDVAATPGVAPAKGGGLPPAVIQAMQGCEALVMVVRAFDNPALSDAPNAVSELKNLQAELILSDLGPLENRRERIRKDAARKTEMALMDRCIAHLEDEQPLSTITLSDEEAGILAGFGLLSRKPLLYLLNQDEGDFDGNLPGDFEAALGGAQAMALCARIEMDIAEMPPEEQPEFLEALGMDSPARDRFVRAAWALLDLICFLTTGEDETRAWPIARGTTAQRAAGRIHSDIERGFIRAEVCAYEELVSLGGEKKAKEAGRLRLEGKEYIVQDGDVMTYRFNV